MAKRKCDDKHGYGCTLEIEYETTDELEKYFYVKGGYVLGVCRECEKRKRRDKAHAGVAGYRYDRGQNHKKKARSYDGYDYGRLVI